MGPEFLIDLSVFRQAAQDVLAGLNPYAREGFFTPPWGLYLFLPLVPWPEPIAQGLWFLLNLGLFLRCLRLMAVGSAAPRAWVVALMLGPLVWPYAYFGNLLGLVFLGLLGLWRWRRSWLALPLVMLKPQLVFIPLALWLIRRGPGEVMRGVLFLLLLNLPLWVIRPSLYSDFVASSLGQRYVETQALHIVALSNIASPGSSAWYAVAAVLGLAFLSIALWRREERTTWLTALLADPLASGGEYAALAVVGARSYQPWPRLLWPALIFLGMPLLGLFLPEGAWLYPLSALAYLVYHLFRRQRDSSPSLISFRNM